jgi:hypothetical protein
MLEECHALEQFRNYPGISESWELVKTGIIVIREHKYRLELWHSFSNPDIAYYVAVYVEHDGMWKKMSDPIYPMGLDANQTMSAAMAFLSERLAA